jgi:hypothetical protein
MKKKINPNATHLTGKIYPSRKMQESLFIFFFFFSILKNPKLSKAWLVELNFLVFSLPFVYFFPSSFDLSKKFLDKK